MSMDKQITEQEGIMFAANPAWERRNKKKGFGSRKAAAPAATVAPEPRTFVAEEPMALETPVAGPTVAARPVLREPVTREPVADEGLMAAPIGRPSARTTTKRAHKTSVAPAALAAGLVALGAVGAVGWYATRGGDDGIPELSPGQATTSEMAAAPMPPVEAPAAPPAIVPAATPSAPAVAEAPPARRVAQAAPRVRPAAAAPSAGDSGMNASTTTSLPEGPQPYTTLNPGAAPPAITPAPAPVTPPVSEAAPAPATEAPAAVPETPPTLPIPPAAQAPSEPTPPTQ